VDKTIQHVSHNPGGRAGEPAAPAACWGGEKHNCSLLVGTVKTELQELHAADDSMSRGCKHAAVLELLSRTGSKRQPGAMSVTPCSTLLPASLELMVQMKALWCLQSIVCKSIPNHLLLESKLQIICHHTKPVDQDAQQRQFQFIS
jgi:hypothetical protein